ncbi:putative membrane protein [Leptospira yanagawae serovar Saopaulo str. Sao Paulo = ATCC 700523]|uniref:Putative membrane protein n=1 Tax=Leptospira yanagawae serovar Saopaulo str. Sao Paulo = ATCC 700523 TaxID=1249483 RepID=A0A5E8HAM0_9LEPT|nr:hypothetical protein [Leptospira yanagawae]EOQ87853.1 putative membrane protein [Leptospira yanagawae serovar Saopaulo str. Sao Paulo = ATCC 700523]
MKCLEKTNLSIGTENGGRSVNLIFLFLILVSPFIVSIWPHITLFSSVILFLLVYSYLNKKLSLFVLLSFVLAYTRVEFFAFAVISVIFTFPFLFDRRRLGAWSSLLVYCLGILALIFNNPTTQSRAYIAFCQHYALSKFNKGVYFDDPWTTCDLLIEKDFGKAGQIKEIIFGNFSALLDHFSSNLVDFFKVLSTRLNVPTFIVFVLIFFMVSFELFRLKRSITKKRLIPTFQSLALLFLLVLTLFGPIFYFPRDHYLIQVLVVALVFVKRSLILFKLNFIRAFPFKFKKIFIIIGLVLIAFFANWSIKSFKTLRNSSLIDECSMVRLVEMVKYEGMLSYSILNPEGDFCVYLKNVPCKTTFPFEKKQNYFGFLEDRNINMIILTDYYKNSPIYKEDKEFKQFLSNGYVVNDKISFRESPLVNCKTRKVLIRNP